MGRTGRMRMMKLLAAGVLYFLLARLGMLSLSLYLDNIALLWLPSGIGLAMVLGFGHSALPVIFLASYLANLPGMQLPDPMAAQLHTAISAGANVLESMLAAHLVRSRLPEGLQRLSDLAGFIFRVCLVATVINAAILTLNLLAGGYIPAPEAGLFAGILVFSNTLGMLLVYPLYSEWRRHLPANRREFLSWSLLGLSLMAMVWLAFVEVYALIFLLPPVLLVWLYRRGDRGIPLMLLLSMTFLVFMAGRTPGAFGVDSIEQSRFMLVTYLFTTTVGLLAMLLQHRSLLEAVASRRSWQFRASHDPVTGLYNRLAFIEQLDREITRSERLGHVFTLGMVDIDHFKRVNDTWGHLVGDRVLRCFAERLKDCLREVDTVARYGGEEFIVLFPEAGAGEAWQALERVRVAFEQQPLEVDGQRIAITISGGLAPWHVEDPQTLDALLNRADRYLYAAKDGGRNRILSEA